MGNNFAIGEKYIEIVYEWELNVFFSTAKLL